MMFEGLGLAVALRVCVCVLSLIKFPVNCGESCIELLLIWAELCFGYLAHAARSF